MSDPPGSSFAGTGKWLEAFVELAQTLAVLRRDRHRIAETETVRLADCGQHRATFCLVGQQHDRLARPAQPVGEMAIGRGDALARVDDEERHIRIGERALRLLLHPAGERAGRGFFEPGRVDHPKGQIGDPSLALAAVARHSGGVVDQSQTPPDEPVEQGGLADIGAAEYRDRKAHRRPTSRRRSRQR